MTGDFCEPRHRSPGAKIGAVRVVPSNFVDAGVVERYLVIGAATGDDALGAAARTRIGRIFTMRRSEPIAGVPPTDGSWQICPHARDP